MASPDPALYRSTLDTARQEIQDLTDQIENLRELLGRLEHRKKTVEHVCAAIGRWVDLTETDTPDLPTIVPPGSDEPESAVVLTEEEILRIAGISQDA